MKFDPAELADLIVNRRVVRIALRRGTIHAVSARDALTLRPLLQPLFDRWVRQVAVRLDGVPPDAIAQAARGLLEDEPLTFAELGRRLGERWPEADAAAWARSRAARWRSCRSRRAACGVAAGRQRTPRSRPGWAPPLDRAGKLEELVLRYLAVRASDRPRRADLVRTHRAGRGRRTAPAAAIRLPARRVPGRDLGARDQPCRRDPDRGALTPPEPTRCERRRRRGPTAAALDRSARRLIRAHRNAQAAARPVAGTVHRRRVEATPAIAWPRRTEVPQPLSRATGTGI